MVDTVAAHHATEAVLAGLLGRAARGEGAAYSADLMTAVMEMQVQEITAALVLGKSMPRSRSPQTSIWMEPPYGIYRTREGFLSLAQADLTLLGRELDAPGLDDLKRRRPDQSQPEALNRWRDEIYFLVQRMLMRDTAAAWDATLTAAGVWCAVVNDYDAFLRHAQTQDALVEVEHPKHGRYRTVAPGIREHGAEPFKVRPSPGYGTGTTEILSQLGYSAQQISSLHEQGTVVATAA